MTSNKIPYKIPKSTNYQTQQNSAQRVNEYERDLYFGGEIYEDVAYEMHKMHMKNVRRQSTMDPPM